MKTLVVLAALAAVAAAGPTSRADTDLDDIKLEKRSPTFKGHYIPTPHHIQPVHHAYVQPIIPHHLGLKKPLIISQPYGHHHHLFRSEEEQPEIHSAEAKESKKTCMKEMEAKCDDEITAKSSESDAATKTEDIDGIVSDSEVAQSLRMAKEAVDVLQKKLQHAEKNPKTDSHMHENVETAKLALEHMQRNFGNLESMNVHARTFTNAEVHDANLKLESARSADIDKLESPELTFKNAADLKSEEERLAQWKDAIENIQKNVELVRNIEDSFQQNTHSEKSAVLEKSSSFKHEIGEEHKQSGLKEEKTSDKHTADVKMAQNIDNKSTGGKPSWQAREHEKSIDAKNEMETSASTLSASKTTLHNENEQKAFRSENMQLEKSSDIKSASKSQLVAKKMPISQPSLKSSEKVVLKNAEENIAAPFVDTTAFMKAAEHHQAEHQIEIKHHSSNGLSSHDEHEMSSQLLQQKMSAEHHQAEHQGHVISSQQEHKKLLSHPREALDTSLNLELPKAKESKFLEHDAAMHGKEEHESNMKSSDLTTGQSQLSAVAVKPAELVTSGHQSEKLLHTHGSHGKSVEDGALFAPTEMNSALKEALVPTKAWKDAHGMSRGAYGGSAALGGLGGSYGYGNGAGSVAGSGAVGVFPNAHVGGCAIPLLLSCSPNVVAGHLAKSHSYGAPSYAAPEYRATENHNSHSKRDITKISRPAKLKRTPPSQGLQQKNILISEKL